MKPPLPADVVYEKDLAKFVADTARLFGWMRYHTHDSRHSPSGFPDEVLLRSPRIIFAELKRQGSKPKPAQQAWLDELADFAARAPRIPEAPYPSVEVYIWRPSDLDRIVEILR